VALALRTGLVAELVAQLESGDLDLVIGPIYPEQVPATVHARPLVHDELVLVLGPRTAARVAGLGDAAADTFVCLPRGSGLRRLLDLAAGAHGVEPRVGLEVSTPQEVRALVAADLGVAVLARSLASAPGPAVVVRPLDPAPAYPAIGLLTRRRPAPTGPARRFADLVQRFTSVEAAPR
jgi:DNA-binding transcriptional LysR family regulator